jgi:cytochrome c553
MSRAAARQKKLLSKDEARMIAANVAKLRASPSWPPLSLPYRRGQFA